MESVTSLSPLGVKYRNAWKTNEANSVFYDDPSRLCSVFLSLLSLISLFLLLKNSNPQTPTLERVSFVKTSLQ